MKACSPCAVGPIAAARVQTASPFLGVGRVLSFASTTLVIQQGLGSALLGALGAATNPDGGIAGPCSLEADGPRPESRGGGGRVRKRGVSIAGGRNTVLNPKPLIRPSWLGEVGGCQWWPSRSRTAGVEIFERLHARSSMQSRCGTSACERKAPNTHYAGRLAPTCASSNARFAELADRRSGS